MRRAFRIALSVLDAAVAFPRLVGLCYRLRRRAEQGPVVQPIGVPACVVSDLYGLSEDEATRLEMSVTLGHGGDA